LKFTTKEKIAKSIFFILLWPINAMLNSLLYIANTFILCRFNESIGDALCMTATINKVHEFGFKKIIVITRYPMFFYGNKKIDKIIQFKKIEKGVLNTILNMFFDAMNGKNFAVFSSNYFDGGYESYLKETKAKLSLVQVHSYHFKRKFDFKGESPRVYFLDGEISELERKFSSLPEKFSLVCPVGVTTYTPNKEWGFNNYQEVVNKTPSINWIQTGISTDPLLNNALDFRGKTSLRELAYIMSKAQFVLCGEGLLNHLAASVGTKSFVIFTGFNDPSIANYETTTPITAKVMPDCAPCWLQTPCPCLNDICMIGITTSMVVECIT